MKISLFNKEMYNGLKKKYTAKETKREKEEQPTRLPN
jgi:hypothetical protein